MDRIDVTDTYQGHRNGKTFRYCYYLLEGDLTSDASLLPESVICRLQAGGRRSQVEGYRSQVAVCRLEFEELNVLNRS